MIERGGRSPRETMIEDLCHDLVAERAELITLLAPLDEAGWRTPTPADGWTILDQITHVAYFDEAARTAIVDPDDFVAQREEALGDVDAYVDRVMLSQRHLRGIDVLPWLEHAGAAFVDAARQADPKVRVPWFGPEMSLASMITSRIMETWAHGQDVFDTLGVTRQPTASLKHVAFLGYRAFANSFLARDLPVPDVDVRVELGGIVFGPADATEIVRGPALDFCLVVTQRRHVDDTTLVADGDVARQWLSIAQAYAGPPGKGRAAGQFARDDV